MLRRLKNFEQKSRMDVRDRNDVLLSIEGWFQVKGDLSHPWFEEYKNSGSNLKFTRWLIRNKNASPEVVSSIGKMISTVDVKLSCRHNDLIRLADTKHYNSCLKNIHGYGRQQLQYLIDPDIAVLYSPDKAGKFVWRSLIRLLKDEKGNHCLAHYRIYGNGPTRNIFKALAEKTGLRIYQAIDVRSGPLETHPNLKLFSPTVHNNAWIKDYIWSDHYAGVYQNRKIGLYVYPDPIA